MIGAIEFIKRNGTMPCPMEFLHSRMLAVALDQFNIPVGGNDYVSLYVDDLSLPEICALYEHNAAGRIELNEIPDTPGVVYVSMGQGLTEWYQSVTGNSKEFDDSDWLTQVEVARRLHWDGKAGEVEVSRLCEKGELRTNGVRGKGKRIDPASILVYVARMKLPWNEQLD